MPIRTVQDPPEARKVAESALTKGQRSNRFGLTLSPSAPIGALGLYNLPLEDLVELCFDNAALTGWRYFQLADGATQGKIADVTSDRDYALAATAQGVLARTVADAGLSADALLANTSEEYEPRILRLPPISMEALWLHGPEDRFFGLQGSHFDLRDDDFLNIAIERATKRLKSMGRQMPLGG